MVLNDWVARGGTIKKILRLVKRVADRAIGTTADILFWRFRHLIDPAWAENYLVEASLHHPHRQLLVEAICRHERIESALEIGCASGPNLFLLSQRLPRAKIYGIDISKKAVQVGMQWMRENGMTNVSLSYGKADNLKVFRDKSMDVVFTDAALIYVGPDKIDSVIKEMLRVARKAIVLIEWSCAEPHAYLSDHWAYNWELLFRARGFSGNLRLAKLTKDIWPGAWARYGYLVEAVF